MNSLLYFFIWYYAFLFSMVIHESSHALAAHKLGDSTGYEGGQVSLNPMPHIKQEPFGTVLVPIISYAYGGWMMGWASVPYDIRWAMENPKRAAIMSFAGPLANLSVVVVIGILIRVGIIFGVFRFPDYMNFTHIVVAQNGGLFSSMALIFSIFFSLNLLLFSFNMIPLSPLDGSGIIPYFLKEETAQKYMLFIKNPAVSLMGLMLAWKIFGYVYEPIHTFFVNVLYVGITWY